MATATVQPPDTAEVQHNVPRKRAVRPASQTPRVKASRPVAANKPVPVVTPAAVPAAQPAPVQSAPPSSVQTATLTISQAARALGIAQGTLRNWANRGYAPHILMPSGYRRFTPEHMDRIREKLEVPEGSARAARSA